MKKLSVLQLGLFDVAQSIALTPEMPEPAKFGLVEVASGEATSEVRAKTMPFIHAGNVAVPVGLSDSAKIVKELTSIVDQLYRYRCDFSTCVTIWDAVLRRYRGGEPDYMKAIAGMSREALDLVSHGFGVLVKHFWVDGGYEDVLGPVYMEIASKYAKSGLGQFFTPWHVAYLMAQITQHDEPEGKSACDPACGSGVMLLAYRAVVAERYGRVVADSVVLYGMDIDGVCCRMASIQCAMTSGWWMTNFMVASGLEGI